MYKGQVYDKAMESLKKAGVSTVELAGVEPNPRVTSVREGVKLCRENGVQVVVPIGGGSSLDCATVIAGSVSSEGDPWDLVIGKAKYKSFLPIVSVLTLAATGSEMDAVAVISNMDTNDKLGTGHPDMRPKASIMDPTYTCLLYTSLQPQRGCHISEMLREGLLRHIDTGARKNHGFLLKKALHTDDAHFFCADAHVVGPLDEGFCAAAALDCVAHGKSGTGGQQHPVLRRPFGADNQGCVNPAGSRVKNTALSAAPRRLCGRRHQRARGRPAARQGERHRVGGVHRSVLKNAVYLTHAGPPAKKVYEVIIPGRRGTVKQGQEWLCSVRDSKSAG